MSVDDNRDFHQLGVALAKPVRKLHRSQQDRTSSRQPVRQQSPLERLIMLPHRVARVDEEAFIVTENVRHLHADEGEEQVFRPQPGDTLQCGAAAVDIKNTSSVWWDRPTIPRGRSGFAQARSFVLRKSRCRSATPSLAHLRWRCTAICHSASSSRCPPSVHGHQPACHRCLCLCLATRRWRSPYSQRSLPLRR